jgi:photosystem II stability/assembly factor-like uncharacterized protein
MYATATAVLISTAALLVLLCLMGRGGSDVSRPALAAPLQITPTVALVDPPSAPNDLDTPIVITGTDFVSVPAVYLGDTSLSDVEWMTSTVLRATVPWGMDPGVYTLTVENPGGESGVLPNAFTVTQGIGVWNATHLYGGKIGEVVINPITPTTVYAVAHDVGIFRSRNAGETWSFVYASSAQDLAVDPVTPTTIYWGSGGLARSDDEGDTWNWLGDLVNLPYPHPTISDTVYATKRWSWGSGGGGGLWRSTDRGQTWVTATNGLTDSAVTGLVFHPTDPMTMYLGTANGNVFRSTDAGDSWSHVAHPINYIMTLAINPRGAHELWASNHCLDVPEITLKSTNVEYTAWITVGTPVAAQPFESIDFPPLAWGDTFSETVFAAGCWAGDLMRTVDGGDTWAQLAEARSGKNDIALHPTVSNTLYTGSRFDGVLISEDGGEAIRIIDQGLTAVVPRQLATVPGQPDVVYAITDREGGIYKATRAGARWQFLEVERVSSGNSFVAVDPFTPTRVYVGNGASGQGAWQIDISEDSGQTWTSRVISAPEPYSDCNAVWPQALRPDPAHPGILLAGLNHFRRGTPFFQAGGIYRSTDYGESWTYVDVGQVISPVTDLAYDALTSTIVYAATGWKGAGTGMLRSTDGGQTWQPMGEGIAALDHVDSLAAEPSDPYRVFAWVGWPNDDLYVSENHGVTWTLAFSPVCHDVRLLFVPSEPPVLHISAMQGLYRSTDGGQSWARAAGTLGYVPIYSLATVTATDRVILYAGTAGGYVQSGAAQTLGTANAGGTLVNAGVYRYAQRTWRVYLPLVLRAYTQ